MFIASFSSRSNVRIHFHSNCAPLPTLLSATSRRLWFTPSSPLLIAPHHTPCSLPLTVSSCPLLLTLCPSLCMPHCPPCSLPGRWLLPLLLALCPSLFLGCLTSPSNQHRRWRRIPAQAMLCWLARLADRCFRWRGAFFPRGFGRCCQMVVS
jgi:hypothetical protein